MMALWDWLGQLTVEKQMIWGYRATLFCAFFSAQIALAFLFRNPRLFTAMALLACMWMCVTGAYIDPREPILSDLITDIASFLEVYVGGLLLAEATKNNEEPQVSWLQAVALLLLLFIVWPKQIAFPEIVADFVGKAYLNEIETKYLASCMLVFVGFASILYGTLRLTGPTLGFFLLFLVIAGYETATIAREYELWLDKCTHLKDIKCPARGAYYTLAFSASKVAYAVILGCIVAYHGMPSDLRGTGLVGWIKKFLYIPSYIFPSSVSPSAIKE